MVVFTCNSCGETLKKSAVEKHNFRCRTSQGVSCMDCNKVFGNDYAKHLSCITEAEKYGGANYVAKELKGRRKQDDWIEAVKNYIANTPNIESNMKANLSKIVAHGNLPKKEAKLRNYLKNCLKCTKDMEAKVINILNQLQGDRKPQNNENKEGEKEKKRKRSSEEEDKPTSEGKANGVVEGDGQESQQPKKKKKKSKHRETEEEEAVKKEDQENGIESNEAVKEEDSQKQKKKKKKSKDKSMEVDPEAMQPALEDNRENGIEDKNHSVVEEEESQKQKKKKRKSKDRNMDENPMADSVPEEQEESKKEKKTELKEETPKKKSKLSEDENKENNKSLNESLQNGEDKNDSDFKWKNSIKKTLNETPERKMKLKKLEKIVVGEYLSVVGKATPEQEAKELFMKKINNEKFIIEEKYIKIK